MKDVIAFLHHKATPLLLSAASGVVIFGLYPGTQGLIAAYFPPASTMVANVSNTTMVESVQTFNMYADEAGMMEDGASPEQI